jgi:prolyl 4-hydroxylase
MAELNKEWRHWVQENLERGVPQEELIQILMTHQFESLIAHKTVFEIAATLAPKQPEAPQNDVTEGFQCPEPCDGVGKPWSVIMAMEKPVIRVYANVLSAEECDRLIELSTSKLKPSTTVDKNTGAASQHEHRTSRGTFFALKENEFIQSIDERLAQIVKLPVENGEGLQILNYQFSGEYKPHFDYFPPEQSGSSVHVKKGGQRVVTVILYLNDVQEGGETVFPEIGVKISPFKGGAVYFSYFQNSQVDPLTLHGGMPVIQGEKWIATRWVRESVYG